MINKVTSEDFKSAGLQLSDEEINTLTAAC